VSGRVYLDYNATAPLRPEARDAMLRALDAAGNPSSVHAEGRAARNIVEEARESMAGLLGVEPAAIVFTSGGTEAANWLLAPSDARERLFLGATEHPCTAQGHRFGEGAVMVLPADEAGRIASPVFENSGARHLVCVQVANNETGVLQDIEALSRVTREAGAFLVCDAVQAAGRVSLDGLAGAADAFFLSAHKFGGPKGVGAAIIADPAFIPEPLIRGGGQEKRQRSGTENIAGIAGMAAALEAALRDLPLFMERASRWQQRLEQGIRDLAPGAIIFGEEASRLPNTTCFALPGLPAETALIALDLDGIAVSSGSACSSGKVERSAVLAAMGVAPALADGAIRVSTGWTSRDADIEGFLARLAGIYGNRRAARAA
jgi:cysteine desulfurase